MKTQSPMLPKFTRVQSEHPLKRKTSRQEINKNDPTIVFRYYDTQNMKELTTEQLRRYFAKEEQLYLTQEDIKKVLSEILQYSFKLPLSDFAQLREYIKNNKKLLEEKSNKNNQYAILFENQLLSEKENVPENSNIFCENDIVVIERSNCDENRIQFLREIGDARNDSIIKLLFDIVFAHSYEIESKTCEFKKPNEFDERYKTYNQIINSKEFKETRNITNMKDIEMLWKEVDISYLTNDHKIKDRRMLREPLFDMIRTTLKINKITTENFVKNVTKKFDKLTKMDMNQTGTLKKNVLNILNASTSEKEKTVKMMRMVLQITNIQPGKSKGQQIEPLYGYFALYNFEENKLIKMTETIRLNSNMDDDIRKMDYWLKDAPVRSLEKFVVDLDPTMQNYKGILFVFKNAEADLTQREMYFSEKTTKKVSQKSFNENEQYLQYVCCGYVDIKYNATRNTFICQRQNDFYPLKIEKEEDLLQLFVQQSGTKLKQSGGSWTCDIFEYEKDKDHEDLIDWNDHPLDVLLNGNTNVIINRNGNDQSNDNPLQKSGKTKSSKASEIGKTIQRDTKKDVSATSLRLLQSLQMKENEYSHNLYIYPLKISGAKLPFKKKTGVSVIKMYLQNSQSISEARALPVFYPVIPGQPFERKAVSSAPYSKSNVYFDEIKAKLPLDMNDSYHLLFIVDDIFESDPTQAETKFGYLPLFTKGHLISNGEYRIDLFKGWNP